MGPALHTRAQETKVIRIQPTYRYMQLGAGASLFTLRDEAMSPLRYRGLNFSAVGAYQKEKGCTFQRFEFVFHYGELLPDIYDFSLNGIAEHLRGELDYAYLRRVRPGAAGPYRWWLGGALSALGTYRLHLLYSNNAYNWEVLTHLNVAGRVARDLRLWGRTFKLNYEAAVPLVGVGWRPFYTSIWAEELLNPEERTLGNGVRSGRFFTLNRFFRYRSRLALDYPFANGNALRLTYAWDYYRYAAEQPTSVGSQQLLLSTLFRF
ncbi:MAG: hypothetical protein WBA12_16120 [Catalinimonas sp.]